VNSYGLSENAELGKRGNVAGKPQNRRGQWGPVAPHFFTSERSSGRIIGLQTELSRINPLLS